MPDSTRYRVVDFIGGRILEAREMMSLQNMTGGIDTAGDVVVEDLNAIYREGALFNTKVSVTSGTTTTVLAPIDNTKPMRIFVRGRWESIQSGEAPAVTLPSGASTLYLNWSLNIVTSATDASLVDASTDEPTANMGQLVLSISTTDTSGVSLDGSTQLAKNTSPIILYTFNTTGTTVTATSVDNVKPDAVGGLVNSGPVKLTTGTSAGVGVASDDPRLTDSRPPAVGSVVDASVRTPVSNGNSNTDGSAQYDLTTDAGGISADKIIWQTYKERISDFLASVRSQLASIVSSLSSHIGVALGSSATHPMPTATQVGAAPLSHVNLPLGIPGSHPATVNTDSGGFVLNQTTGFGTSGNDPAYGVFEGGTYKAGLQHNGDFYTTLINSIVANPGGTPLNFTGPFTGLKSVAQVVADHVNQNSHANPHGLTLADLTIGTPALGSILIYNGSTFVAKSLQVQDKTGVSGYGYNDPPVQNNSGAEILVCVFGFIGGNGGTQDGYIGATSSTVSIHVGSSSATPVTSAPAGTFLCFKVPPGWWYKITSDHLSIEGRIEYVYV